ncbi:MAG: hypothetical protein HRU69_00165 [Flammeovirgaceae bacterium]|nr:MAG: hypothetical protein HRU69_00165 [Flammeovirgaceae bacterium]
MNNLKHIGKVSTLLLTFFAGPLLAQQPAIQYFRPYDQRGVNVFEINKHKDTVAYDGFKLRIGAGFTQGFQKFTHSNSARVVLADGATTWIEDDNGNFINRVTGVAAPGTFAPDPNVYGAWVYTPDPIGAPNTQRVLTNSNQLYEMSAGFPLAQANLYFDVQLADGVRLHLANYMASHHHNEFWVKGGYLQVDKVSFLNSAFMDKLWTNLSLRVGHMEINYGDAHFRRSDGGHTLWNPFIENNIMDAFTTEIGWELYWYKNDLMLMMGYTDGEIQGNVTKPNERDPNLYWKAAYDKNVNEDLRVRLSGTFLTTKSSIRNTLYGGDRTGSNYQFVMDNNAATVTTAFTSGRFNPGITDNITSWVINPFIKFKGLELFGTYEVATGNSPVENGELQYSDPTNNDGTLKPVFDKLDKRKATQSAVDLLYRFGKKEQFFVGVKYNSVDAEIALGQATNTASYIYQGDRVDVTIKRTAFAGGWFITKNVLLKGEYVNQKYTGFPEFFDNRSTSAAGFKDTSMFANGEFKGFVIQGVVTF